MRRLAANRHRGPGDIFRRAAPVDDDLLPRHRQHVGRDARKVDARVRAEVADARLYVQLAVGPDRHEPVEPNRAGAVRPDGDADAADLGALPFTGARLALVPLEELGTTIERLFHGRGRDVRTVAVRAGRAVHGLALR